MDRWGREKTIGIFGTGKILRSVYKKAQVFDMNVLGFNVMEDWLHNQTVTRHIEQFDWTFILEQKGWNDLAMWFHYFAFTFNWPNPPMGGRIKH